MYSVNQIVGNIYNGTKQHSIEIIPDELIFEVFSHLNLATLGTICCVSKSWKRLADNPLSLIHI